MRIEQTDKGLMVYDFDMASYLGKSERGDLGKNVGPDYFKEAIVVDKMRRAKNKKPFVFFNHTDKDDSRIVGTIEQMKFMNHKLYGDLLIEDVDIAEKFKRGKFQERSIEFSQDTPFIAGVALLDEAEGHFSEELTPVPISKYENLAADPDFGKISLVSLKINKLSDKEELPMDELKEILAQIQRENAEMKAQIAELTNPKKPYDALEDVEQTKTEIDEKATALALEREMEREAEVWTIRLERYNGPTAKQIKKHLLSRASNLKEIQLEGELLQARLQNAKGVTLEPDPTEVDQLKLEYEKGRAAGKFQTLSLEQYKDINKNFVQ